MQTSTIVIIGGLGKADRASRPDISQAVAAIALASGRHIGYETVPIDAFIAEMTAFGLPQEATDLLHELFTQVLDGHNPPVMDGVSQILGRQPKDFSDYANQTAATGIWSVQS